MDLDRFIDYIVEAVVAKLVGAAPPLSPGPSSKRSLAARLHLGLDPGDGGLARQPSDRAARAITGLQQMGASPSRLRLGDMVSCW